MADEPYSPLQSHFNKTALDNEQILSSAHWNELRTFLAVAKHRSFKQAAEALHLSHPTVSRQVKHLEQVLKSKLVASSGAGTLLTDAGLVLAKEIARIDGQIFDLERSVRYNTDEAAGSVRISITDGLGALWERSAKRLIF